MLLTYLFVSRTVTYTLANFPVLSCLKPCLVENNLHSYTALETRYGVRALVHQLRNIIIITLRTLRKHI